MSTEIITGSFTSGIHERICREIEELIERKEEVYLIVPEQNTLSAEKEMCEFLHPSAPLYFEVSNFTRFANTAFRKLGGLSGKHADRTKRALAMWQCLTELSPVLKSLAPRGAVREGLVNKAIDALAEAESFGIDSLALSNAEKLVREENPRLADKLSDLSLISASYKKLLLEKYNDTGDGLGALVEKLNAYPDFLRGSNVYIENFTSFTESQYALIAVLMERANVKVALNISKYGEDSFEFSETRLAKKRLTRLAAKSQAQLKLTKLAGNGSTKSSLISEISEYLWKSYGEIDNESLQEKDSVRIFEASHPYEECDFIAADIKRRVMEGASYSDFAIVPRRAEAYIGTLDEALKKCGIPHFISKNKDISKFEATRFIYSAIATVSGGFRKEDLISYAKCAFSGVSREACDEFELYVEKWQLNGKRFYEDKKWTMSPDGYTARVSENREEQLAKVNETKEKLVNPLLKLSNAFKTCQTVKDFALSLFEFMNDAEVEKKISERSEKLYSIGEKESAEENASLWQLICGALDTLVEAAGEYPSDTEGFKNRLELVFSEVKLGRIPSFTDEVTVGSADTLRLSGKRHLYMPGVNLGEFPKIPEDLAFFHDRDKAKLKELGIEILSSSEFDYARELFYFSRVFSSAKESVTLIYTNSDFSFKSAKPSAAVDRIIKLTDKAVFPRKIKDLTLTEKVYSEEAALLHARESEKLKNALISLGLEEKIKDSEKEIKNSNLTISEEIARLMYPGDVSLTQTRIDKFTDCPLSYFCQYKLSLSENEKAEFDARNIGSFVHSILENFFKSTKDIQKPLNDLSDEEKKTIAEEAASSYLDSVAQDTAKRGRTKFTLERLKSSAMPVIDELCDELSGAKFEPRFFELDIALDKKDSPEAVKYELSDGKYARVFGSIDRVDTYKSENDVYVRVIDYKTGAKNFSPEDLDDGRNLQMFLYLESVVKSKNESFLARIGVGEGGKLIPAGVIYVKTNFSDVKVNHADEESAKEAVKEMQKREGMLLDDTESIDAMNRDFIPVSFKKDGEPSAASKKFLYTPGGWDEISGKIKTAVVKVAEDMKSGRIEAKPTVTKDKTPCEWCKFKPICRNVK